MESTGASTESGTGSVPAPAPPATPPGVVRYRCQACGNRTRFDVVTTRRTRAFHHYSLGGELSVDDEQVLAQTVEEVSCRWCGTGASVERVPEGEPWSPGG